MARAQSKGKPVTTRQVTPLIGLDAIRAEVETLASQPFKGMLAHALYGGQRIPWAKLARTKPLDYVRCVKDLALLAGYTPEAYKAQQANVLVVERLSDADLLAQLADVRAQLANIPTHVAANPVDIVDAQVIDSNECSGQTTVPNEVTEMEEGVALGVVQEGQQLHKCPSQENENQEDYDK